VRAKRQFRLTSAKIQELDANPAARAVNARRPDWFGVASSPSDRLGVKGGPSVGAYLRAFVNSTNWSNAAPHPA
jgi:hypothetical protein